MSIIRFKTDSWLVLKQEFRIDTLVLVGSPQAYYKGYCLNNYNRNAVYFNLFHNGSSVSLIPKANIKYGDLTSKVPIDEAIDYLKSGNFKTATKPNEEMVKEILHFLESNW